MAKIGFWESLVGDVGYFERSAINQTHEQMEISHAAQAVATDDLRRQIRRQVQVDHAQSLEMARLRRMVKVLAELVVELGIDRTVLEYRMEAALDELETVETMQQGIGPGGPYRGGDAAPAEQAEPTARCGRCAETVLARRTQITEEGTVCDRCYY